jgi:hypothetical protein
MKRRGELYKSEMCQKSVVGEPSAKACLHVPPFRSADSLVGDMGSASHRHSRH